MQAEPEKGKSITLGRSAIQITFSKVITSAISLVTAMLLSRFRTLEEYGTYSQLLLVVNLVSAIFMLGLPNSINYFLARAENEREKQNFLSTYYTLTTLLSLFIGGILCCSVSLLERYFDNPLIHGFLYFLAIYPWISVTASSVENVLIVYNKSSWVVLYRVLSSILLLAIVVIVQLLGLGFQTYMLLFTAISFLLSLVVYGLAAVLSGGLSFCINYGLIKNVLFFSVPMGLSTLVGTLNSEIDKLLIGNLLSTESLAVYSNAAKELPVSIIAAAFTAVLLPRLTKLIKEKHDLEAIKLWGNAIYLSYAFIAFIVTGVFVYAIDVVTLLYSEKYISGVAVFRIYTVVLLFRCTYFGMLLNARGKTKKIFFCSIFSLLLNCILNPVMYWWLGFIGPALATLIAVAAVQLLQLWYTAREMKISYRDTFPWKRILSLTVTNVLLGVAFFLGKKIFPLENVIGSIGESIMLGIIGAGLYCLVINKGIKAAWKELNSEV